MKPTSKRSNRERILDVAADLFLTRGYAVTSMDDLVAVSKIAKTNIYYHYKSKEELLAAITDRQIAHYAEAALHIASREELPVPARLELLQQMLTDRAAASTSLGGCPLLTLYVQTAAEWPEGRERIGQFFKQQMELVAHLLQEGIRRGELRPELPVQAASSLIVASVEGALFLSHAVQSDQVLRHLREMLAAWLMPAP